MMGGVLLVVMVLMVVVVLLMVVVVIGVVLAGAATGDWRRLEIGNGTGAGSGWWRFRGF